MDLPEVDVQEVVTEAGQVECDLRTVLQQLNLGGYVKVFEEALLEDDLVFPIDECLQDFSLQSLEVDYGISIGLHRKRILLAIQQLAGTAEASSRREKPLLLTESPLAEYQSLIDPLVLEGYPLEDLTPEDLLDLGVPQVHHAALQRRILHWVSNGNGGERVRDVLERLALLEQYESEDSVLLALLDEEVCDDNKATLASAVDQIDFPPSQAFHRVRIKYAIEGETCPCDLKVSEVLKKEDIPAFDFTAKYMHLFRDQRVEEEGILFKLTADDLRVLGIKVKMHRSKIQKRILKLREGRLDPAREALQSKCDTDDKAESVQHNSVTVQTGSMPNLSFGESVGAQPKSAVGQSPENSPSRKLAVGGKSGSNSHRRSEDALPPSVSAREQSIATSYLRRTSREKGLLSTASRGHFKRKSSFDFIKATELTEVSKERVESVGAVAAIDALRGHFRQKMYSFEHATRQAQAHFLVESEVDSFIRIVEDELHEVQLMNEANAEEALRKLKQWRSKMGAAHEDCEVEVTDRNGRARARKDMSELAISADTLRRVLQPVDFGELVRIIESSKETEEDLRGKDVILLIGLTGAGKTTTILYLSGVRMEKVKAQIGGKCLAPKDEIPPNLVRFATSASNESCTKHVQAITVSSSMTPSEIVICDTPGFNDSGGAVADLANGHATINAIRCCKSVRPVFLFSRLDLNNRIAERLGKIAGTIDEIVGGRIADFIESFSYLFTRGWEDFDLDDMEGLSRTLLDAQRTALSAGELTNEASIMLEDIRSRLEKGQKMILRPELSSPSPSDIIDAICKTPAIEDPEQVFQHFAAESKAFVKDQCAVEFKKIKIAMEDGASVHRVRGVLPQLKLLLRVGEVLDLRAVMEGFQTAMEYVLRQLKAKEDALRSDLLKIRSFRYHGDPCLVEADVFAARRLAEYLLTFRGIQNLQGSNDEPRVEREDIAFNVEQSVLETHKSLQDTVCLGEQHLGAIHRDMNMSEEMLSKSLSIKCCEVIDACIWSLVCLAAFRTEFETILESCGSTETMLNTVNAATDIFKAAERSFDHFLGKKASVYMKHFADEMFQYISSALQYDMTKVSGTNPLPQQSVYKSLMLKARDSIKGGYKEALGLLRKACAPLDPRTRVIDLEDAVKTVTQVGAEVGKALSWLEQLHLCRFEEHLQRGGESEDEADEEFSILVGRTLLRRELRQTLTSLLGQVVSHCSDPTPNFQAIAWIEQISRAIVDCLPIGFGDNATEEDDEELPSAAALRGIDEDIQRVITDLVDGYCAKLNEAFRHLGLVRDHYLAEHVYVRLEKFAHLLSAIVNAEAEFCESSRQRFPYADERLSDLASTFRDTHEALLLDVQVFLAEDTTTASALRSIVFCQAHLRRLVHLTLSNLCGRDLLDSVCATIERLDARLIEEIQSFRSVVESWTSAESPTDSVKDAELSASLETLLAVEEICLQASLWGSSVQEAGTSIQEAISIYGNALQRLTTTVYGSLRGDLEKLVDEIDAAIDDIHGFVVQGGSQDCAQDFKVAVDRIKEHLLRLVERKKYFSRLGDTGQLSGEPTSQIEQAMSIEDAMELLDLPFNQEYTSKKLQQALNDKLLSLEDSGASDADEALRVRTAWTILSCAISPTASPQHDSVLRALAEKYYVTCAEDTLDLFCIAEKEARLRKIHRRLSRLKDELSEEMDDQHLQQLEALTLVSNRLRVLDSFLPDMSFGDLCAACGGLMSEKRATLEGQLKANWNTRNYVELQVALQKDPEISMRFAKSVRSEIFSVLEEIEVSWAALEISLQNPAKFVSSGKDVIQCLRSLVGLETAFQSRVSTEFEERVSSLREKYDALLVSALQVFEGEFRDDLNGTLLAEADRKLTDVAEMRLELRSMAGILDVAAALEETHARMVELLRKHLAALQTFPKTITSAEFLRRNPRNLLQDLKLAQKQSNDQSLRDDYDAAHAHLSKSITEKVVNWLSDRNAEGSNIGKTDLDLLKEFATRGPSLFPDDVWAKLKSTVDDCLEYVTEALEDAKKMVRAELQGSEGLGKVVEQARKLGHGNPLGIEMHTALLQSIKDGIKRYSHLVQEGQLALVLHEFPARYDEWKRFLNELHVDPGPRSLVGGGIRALEQDLENFVSEALAPSVCDRFREIDAAKAEPLHFIEKLQESDALEFLIAAQSEWLENEAALGTVSVAHAGFRGDEAPSFHYLNLHRRFKWKDNAPSVCSYSDLLLLLLAKLIRRLLDALRDPLPPRVDDWSAVKDMIHLFGEIESVAVKLHELVEVANAVSQEGSLDENVREFMTMRKEKGDNAYRAKILSHMESLKASCTVTLLDLLNDSTSPLRTENSKDKLDFFKALESKLSQLQQGVDVLVDEIPHEMKDSPGAVIDRIKDQVQKLHNEAEIHLHTFPPQEVERVGHILGSLAAVAEAFKTFPDSKLRENAAEARKSSRVSLVRKCEAFKQDKVRDWETHGIRLGNPEELIEGLLALQKLGLELKEVISSEPQKMIEEVLESVRTGTDGPYYITMIASFLRSASTSGSVGQGRLLEECAIFQGVSTALYNSSMKEIQPGLVLQYMTEYDEVADERNQNRGRTPVRSLTKIEIDNLRGHYEKYYEEYNSLVTRAVKDICKIPPLQQTADAQIRQILSRTKISLVTEARQLAKSAATEFGMPSCAAMRSIVAYIFAWWSLDSAAEATNAARGSHDSVEKDWRFTPHDITVHLKKPNAAQILSVFRLLGMSGILPREHTSFFSLKRWIAPPNDRAIDLESHLAEIKTGEGKSVAIAGMSCALGIFGFSVDCACYSKYLSTRDFRDFRSMYQAFGVAENVKYDTFDSLCRRFLMARGDVKPATESFLTTGDFDQFTPFEESRRRILIIDEVDVFFKKDFYGSIYNVFGQIHDEAVANLMQHIWDTYHQRKHGCSLERVQESIEYEACLKLFQEDQTREAIFVELVKTMIHDFKDVDSEEYRVINGRIMYQVQDEWTSRQVNSFYTAFAYLKEKQKNPTKIKADALQDALCLNYRCGSFSYSEIPTQYTRVIGVTGTLRDLVWPQREVLRRKYRICRETYIPSVYGLQRNRELSWHPDNPEFVVITKSPNLVCDEDDDESEDARSREQLEWYDNILREIEKRQESQEANVSQRAVLVFFVDENALTAFAEHPEVRNRRVFPHIVESDSVEEKEKKIAKATVCGRVTLLTRHFGRGVDFRAGEALKSAGGLHVIQTFVSEEVSEETQIMGRTARQGDHGSFSMILKGADLNYFGLSRRDIKEMHLKGSFHSRIAAARDELFRTTYPQDTRFADELKDIHESSVQFLKCLCEKDKAGVAQFLLRENSLTVESGDVVRTIVLLDATYSMHRLLYSAKLAVKSIFENCFAIFQDKSIPIGYVEMQMCVYRNYSSQAKCFAHSGWYSSAAPLQQWLDSQHSDGGQGHEALELALDHVLKEHDRHSVYQAILIGDAAPNSRAETDEKRQGKRKIPPQPVYFDDMLQEVIQKQIPVHALYVHTGWSDAQSAFEKIKDDTGSTYQVLGTGRLSSTS